VGHFLRHSVVQLSATSFKREKWTSDFWRKFSD